MKLSREGEQLYSPVRASSDVRVQPLRCWTCCRDLTGCLCVCGGGLLLFALEWFQPQISDGFFCSPAKRRRRSCFWISALYFVVVVVALQKPFKKATSNHNHVCFKLNIHDSTTNQGGDKQLEVSVTLQNRNSYSL